MNLIVFMINVLQIKIIFIETIIYMACYYGIDS